MLSCVQFMLVLDDTAVNVALASIRRDLGFGVAGLAWVVNAYLLAFGGLLVASGRAGDLFGRRRVFLAGVALFGLASLGCGLAQEPWHLVVSRCRRENVELTRRRHSRPTHTTGPATRANTTDPNAPDAAEWHFGGETDTRGTVWPHLP